MVLIEIKDPIKIRISIAETGYSLRKFAEKVEISHSYLSQILNDKKNPSATVAYKIASGLNKKIEDIFLISLVDETYKVEHSETKVKVEA